METVKTLFSWHFLNGKIIKTGQFKENIAICAMLVTLKGLYEI